MRNNLQVPLIVPIHCIRNVVCCRYYLLTYSKEQSPSWEANRFSASHVTSRILWNPKVHYRIQKSPRPVPILSQINPINTFDSTSWRSIILPSTPRLTKWLFSLMFPHLNPVSVPPRSHTCHMSSASYYSWFDHLCNIWRVVQITKLLFIYSRL